MTVKSAKILVSSTASSPKETSMPSVLNRREFIASSTTATAMLMSGCSSTNSDKLKLGFDNFSIRALKLNARELIDYAAELKVDSLLLSDMDVYESFDASYFKDLKAQAVEQNIELHTGTGSICPTSKSFKDKHGTAEVHLNKALDVAIALGSPVVRCYLGSARDRKSASGLVPHLNATVNVCKSVEIKAKEAGVKIAIENHAGDLTARVLRQLIEKAGPDYVGATIDSGNATWTMESPYKNLELLAPYVVSSGIRDSIVHSKGNNISATWTAMGEGTVDWPLYFSKWQKSCPEVPIFMEIISGLTKSFPPPTDKEFWKHYQDINLNDYNEFKTMTAKGNNKLISYNKTKVDKKELFTPEYMKAQLEQSLSYCKDILNIGRKA